MNRCFDCKHFYYDVDHYPVCAVHHVMVSGATDYEETSACFRFDGVDRYEPKEGLNEIQNV